MIFSKNIGMQKFSFLIGFMLLGILLFISCTPKTTEQVPTEVVEEAPPAPEPTPVDLSPCPKFTDAPNQDEAETNYVLYRDFLRAKDYEGAYSY